MFSIPQQDVINEDGRHVIVSAVAGSGKTTTLIGRLVRLVNDGAQPSRILVLMFGKDAQSDFSRRLSVAAQANRFTAPNVMTFHSFGMKLVGALEQRRILPRMKLLKENYQVANLARAALAEINSANLSDKTFDLTNEVIAEFVEVVDYVKGSSSLSDLRDYLSSPDAKSPLARFKKDFLSAFLIFERIRHEEKVRTFSDLIFDPVTAILNEPLVAEFVANRYDHILVDEFQDINLSQWSMLKSVAGTRAQIVAVGDEDQAIYGWRGSSVEFMYSLFEQDYPDSVRLTLPNTYRYGHRLALAANHLIVNNQMRADKMCLASQDNPDTTIAVVMSHADSGQPAVDAVSMWVNDGRKLSEVAILLREYSHSASVEASLLKNDIPYRIVGAEPFFNRAEILSLRGNLQLVCGGLEAFSPALLPNIVKSMLRIPGLFIRADLIEQLVKKISLQPDAFIQIMSDFEFQLSGGKGALKGRKLREAIDVWRYLSGAQEATPADTLLTNLVRKQDLYAFFTRNDAKQESSNERVRMVQQLIQVAKNGQHSVRSFVDYLNNLTERYAAMDVMADHVLLTSIHRAKGMEWPHVILPELADSKFPGGGDTPIKSLIEDERRLFYVGITRAMERLTLVCPKDPQLQKWSSDFNIGHPPINSIVASRFLFEGNFYASVLVGKKLHGKDCGVTPKDSPVFEKYRQSFQC